MRALLLASPVGDLSAARGTNLPTGERFPCAEPLSLRNSALAWNLRSVAQGQVTLRGGSTKTMKIQQLAAAFKQVVSGEKKAVQPEILPPQPEQPERSRPAPTAQIATPDQDRIEVSDEAVFRYAVSKFDPHRITSADARALFDVLHEGAPITPRDHAILSDGLSAGSGRFGDQPQVPRNLVADFQDRMARQLGGSDIAGVERTGRALAILGRLEGVRAEGLDARRLR